MLNRLAKNLGRISLSKIFLSGILVAVSMFLIASMFINVGCTQKKAEINVYTALEEEHLEPYLASFKEQYPEITINITRDSTGIITAKLLAEKDNPQADVIWGTAATSLLVLDQEGMLEGYSPKGIENIYPEFKDSKNDPAHWVGIDAWMTAFTVNTIEAEAKGVSIPLSYSDLLKPEYKGMVVMPNPASSGTGFLTVSAIIQLLGEKEGWDYLDKLHENIAVYTHSGSKPAKMAGAGEYPIGISFGYKGLLVKAEGAPVEVIFPSEGSGWDLEANALMKKSKIKKEAKLFLDWAISEAAMKEYNKNYAIICSKTVEANVPEGFPKEPLTQLIENDFNWAAANREAILAEWTSRYDSRSEPK